VAVEAEDHLGKQSIVQRSFFLTAQIWLMYSYEVDGQVSL
jgi:hypothetical protein